MEMTAGEIGDGDERVDVIVILVEDRREREASA